jgi:predicted lipid-binding transport protein (Tim44 family)
LTAIVILALVALFIGLRLYNVLGERTGHEQPIAKPADADQRVAAPAETTTVPRALGSETDDMAYLPTAGPGVRALLSADPAFDVARFLEGAKAAYRLILESFWKGDLEAIKPHVAPHVFETFADAVAQRAKDGHSLDNRLVALDPPVIKTVPFEEVISKLNTVPLDCDTIKTARDIGICLGDSWEERGVW